MMDKENSPQPPSYGGIVLEPDALDYEAIDPPLRRLIRLMNLQPWLRTYGCCAGSAHHGEDLGPEHEFFIGLFVSLDASGAEKLRLWLDEANRLNGSTGLRAGLEYVHKHALGQGPVDGCCAYRVAIFEAGGRNVSTRQHVVKRLIHSLEMAWEVHWPINQKRKGPSANPVR